MTLNNTASAIIRHLQTELLYQIAYRPNHGLIERLTAQEAYAADDPIAFLQKLIDQGESASPLPQKLADAAASICDRLEPSDLGGLTACDHCACSDPRLIRRNGSGELQCENCGHSETP